MNTRREFLTTTSVASAAIILPFMESYASPIATSTKTDLSIFATNWGYEGDIFQFCESASKAGYDGIEVWVPANENDLAPLTKAVKQFGLKIGLLAGGGDPNFVTHKNEFYKSIERGILLNPVYINCHSGKDYFTFDQNKELFEYTIKRSGESSIPIYHETHRGRSLFAAHVTKPFLEKLKDLKITMDISHWCNVHESMLEDQKETIAIALERAEHIHARIGHPEGPQVNDPRAPEWESIVKMHFAWWDTIVTRKRAEGKPITILTEFGPPPYLPTIPYTNLPIANQWDINVYMMQILRKRYN